MVPSKPGTTNDAIHPGDCGTHHLTFPVVSVLAGLERHPTKQAMSAVGQQRRHRVVSQNRPDCIEQRRNARQQVPQPSGDECQYVTRPAAS